MNRSPHLQLQNVVTTVYLSNDGSVDGSPQAFVSVAVDLIFFH